jgi:hypothetical protein
MGRLSPPSRWVCPSPQGSPGPLWSPLASLLQLPTYTDPRQTRQPQLCFLPLDMSWYILKCPKGSLSVPSPGFFHLAGLPETQPACWSLSRIGSSSLPLFIHLPVKDEFCFYFLSITNKAPVNFQVHIFEWISIFISLGLEWLGHKAAVGLTFKETSRLFSKVVLLICSPSNRIWDFQVATASSTPGTVSLLKHEPL